MLNNLDEINPAELEKLFHNSLSDKRQTYKQTRPSASSAMCQRQIMLNMSLEPEWTTISKSLDFYAQIGNTAGVLYAT